MQFKKLFIWLVALGTLAGTVAFALPSIIYNNTNVQFKRAVIDVASSTGTAGQCFTSTGTSTLWGACSSGSTPPPGIVATSTANQFAYYLDATTVTGTPGMTFLNGAIAFTTNTTFTNSTFTSATTTNLAVLTTLSLPANSITDAMVVAGLTISGGTVDNSPIGSIAASTGIFTSLTSTSATSTNLYASLASLVNLTFSSATGTYITSTNGYFSSILTIPYTSSLLTQTTGTIGVDLTSGQLRWNNGTQTSTLVGYTANGFTIASSSLVLTASNTIPFGFPMANETWLAYGCFTTSTGGTLATTTVRFGNGIATWMTSIQATSSKGGNITPINTVSTNNTFAQGAQRYVQIGNIVGTFDWLSCQYKMSVDFD